MGVMPRNDSEPATHWTIMVDEQGEVHPLGSKRGLRPVDVVAVDALLSDTMCDRIIDELVVQAGEPRGFASDKVPFARWDMKAALRRALALPGTEAPS